MPIEHMVWMKFREGVSDEQIEQHLENLRSLKEQVPVILDLTVGPNITDRSGGFTHGLLVRLQCPSCLEAYQNHAAHQAVAEPLKRDAELLAMDIQS